MSASGRHPFAVRATGRARPVNKIVLPTHSVHLPAKRLSVPMVLPSSLYPALQAVRYKCVLSLLSLLRPVECLQLNAGLTCEKDMKECGKRMTWDGCPAGHMVRQMQIEIF